MSNAARTSRRYKVSYEIEVTDHYPAHRQNMDELDLVAEAMQHAMLAWGRRDGTEFEFGSGCWKATARKLPGQAVVEVVQADV